MRLTPASLKLPRDAIQFAACSDKSGVAVLVRSLLRRPPSREQRRLAMEKDMLSVGLSEPWPRKEDLCARWRLNEIHLREWRRKVDVSAFVMLPEQREPERCTRWSLRMLRKGQEGHVRAERDALESASLVSLSGGAA
jgi:protein-serine/threonine kinase